jgi:hypothetical protein
VWRSGDDATGTLRANQIEGIPSIISIECASIILISLIEKRFHRIEAAPPTAEQRRASVIVDSAWPTPPVEL